MTKIILLPIPALRLPRRLLNDGWWLDSPPVRSTVVALPPGNPSKPGIKPKLKFWRGHLTLVISEK